MEHMESIATLITALLTLAVLILTYFKTDPNTEIEVYKTISSAKEALTDASLSFALLSSKKEKMMLSAEEERTLDINHARRSIAIENYLNAYDVACLQYRNGTIHKSRFKATYHGVIREIMESDTYQEYLNKPSSPYVNLIWAYRKWEGK